MNMMFLRSLDFVKAVWVAMAFFVGLFVFVDGLVVYRILGG